MYEKKKVDEPKHYIERSIAFTIVTCIIAALLDWLSVYMLININPWGTLVGVPAIALTLQALWLMVNPYAIIFDDKLNTKIIDTQKTFIRSPDFNFHNFLTQKIHVLCPILKKINKIVHVFELRGVCHVDRSH